MPVGVVPQAVEVNPTPVAGSDPLRPWFEAPVVPSVPATPRRTFARDEALAVATLLCMDFELLPYDLEQFRMGMDVELEHGRRSPATDVTSDDPVITGKIALAHLNEFPDYYTRLAVMEREAASHWRGRI
jgi:hypothetical protein